MALPHRHLRHHRLHQVRRGLRHAPPCAGRAHTAALARERDHAIPTAAIAVHAKETLAGHPAGDELTQRGNDEARQRVAAPARIRNEGIQLLLDHAANEVFGGNARNIGRRNGGSGRWSSTLRHAHLSHDKRARVDDTDGMF